MTSLQCLREVLARLEPDRELWRAPTGESVRAQDLVRCLAHSRNWLRPLQGRSVALHATSDRSLAPLLVLLEGVARTLTLLPTGVRLSALASIVARAEVEILVTTDRTLPVPDGVRVLAVDEQQLWEAVVGQAAGLDEVGGVAVVQSASRSQADPHPGPLPPAGEGAGRTQAGEGAEKVVPLTRTAWVLATSGTTGEPKLVAHTLASLTRSAKHDVSRGREYRWGSLYNLTGFAGLQVFLQSWCGGSCLILSRPGTSLEQRVDDLIAGACNALSATPTMWRKLIMSCPVQRLPLTQITLGGEIVDQPILDALRRLFPAAKIIHIYASTEAGVGFAVRDGRAGFPASYVETETEPRAAIATSGVRIRVDEDGLLLLRADRGEQEYLRESAPLKHADGFVDTGDLVTRRGDRFFFLGRANGTINVGGNKVHPEEVESCLLECEGVLLARVTSRPSPFTGSLVQADVVVDPAWPENWEEVRRRVIAHCRVHMEPYKVPAILKKVDQLEATSSGKIKRVE